MRHIKKIDASTELKANLQSGELGKPYVVSNGESIDWNTQTPSAVENYNSYFWIRSFNDAVISPSSAVLESGATIYYSTDEGDSKTWTEFSEGILVSFDKVYFKSDFGRSDLAYQGKIFDSTANYMAGGNIMSLFAGDNFRTTRGLNNCAERNFFYNDTYLTGIDQLVINLDYIAGGNAFAAMFRNCTSLTSMPEYIYIKKISSVGCYSMFEGCTGITRAVIYADEFEGFGSLGSMFNGCQNLNDITFLAKTINGNGMFPFSGWVSAVAASGTFTKHKDATFWETGTGGIPNGWTVVDAE